jgi:hypothetical protein
LGGRRAAKHKASGGTDVVELGACGGRHKEAVDEHARLGARRRPHAQIDSGLGPFYSILGGAHPATSYNRTLLDHQL